MGSNASDPAGVTVEEVSLADLIPPERLRPGQSVLVAGPSMVGKDRVAYGLLGDALGMDGEPLCLTTSDPASYVRDRYREFATASVADAADLRVVDATGAAENGSVEGERGSATWTASSPGDLTGIGVAVSKAVSDLPDARLHRSRFLLDNLSTLLLYADVRTVYRFVHTLLGRVKSVDGHVLAVLHTDALDDQARDTLVGLFDVVVDVRSRDGETELRVRGLEGDGEPTPWRRFAGGGGS
jgi:KaiC/GvpD/RAD55 family RecA-like ATPase